MNYSESDLNIIPTQNGLRPVMNGVDEISSFIMGSLSERWLSNPEPLIIAFDGYVGADWSIVLELKEKLEEQGVSVGLIDSTDFFKNSQEIWKMIEPCITVDQHFGKMYRGDLNDFLDNNAVVKFKEKIRESNNNLFICFGYGSSSTLINASYDYVFYIDVTHEDFVKSVQKENLWFVPKGALNAEGVADVGMSIQTFKLTRYVYAPLFDKHRRNVLRKMDFYITTDTQLKIIPRSTFDYVMSRLSRQPFKLKPLYIQGPWGGQWIKQKREIPEDYKNCAWAFEAVTSDMSLLVELGEDVFEVPFDTFLASNPKYILGKRVFNKFGYFFPLRVHYDDSYDGGNMAIQVHPDHSYVRKQFSEKVGQQEAYYIVETKDDSRVFLGLRDGIDIADFYQEALESKESHVPLNYEEYVNSFPSKPGDLFLIPSGTVHALGKDQICLEIGTSYGYTFHVYDYLRPDLNGNLREIHLDHAFNVINSHLKLNFSHERLKPMPKVIAVQENGTEYLFERVKEILFEVHRVEFSTLWRDDTLGDFHILTVIKGDVTIRAENDMSNSVVVTNSKTVIVPACFGKYLIESDQNCVIIKVLVKKRVQPTSTRTL
ncbi:MAG: class I mannose-6-phosphate isomerase [Fervidobacterium sp.]